MKCFIDSNSKIFEALEKALDRKINYISEREDEDIIHFTDGTSTPCVIEFVFNEQIQINVTILNDKFNPVQEINLTL